MSAAASPLTVPRRRDPSGLLLNVSSLVFFFSLFVLHFHKDIDRTAHLKQDIKTENLKEMKSIVTITNSSLVIFKNSHKYILIRHSFIFLFSLWLSKCMANLAYTKISLLISRHSCCCFGVLISGNETWKIKIKKRVVLAERLGPVGPMKPFDPNWSTYSGGVHER